MHPTASAIQPTLVARPHAGGITFFQAPIGIINQFGGTDSNTFQAILYEGSDCIDFRYGDIDPGSPTVGVENQDGSAGAWLERGLVRSAGSRP